MVDRAVTGLLAIGLQRILCLTLAWPDKSNVENVLI